MRPPRARREVICVDLRYWVDRAHQCSELYLSGPGVFFASFLRKSIEKSRLAEFTWRVSGSGSVLRVMVECWGLRVQSFQGLGFRVYVVF